MPQITEYHVEEYYPPQRKTFKVPFAEILVILVILTILAAILFPVFLHPHRDGRHASCQSNLKQISLGIAQYLQDYDGAYPRLAFFTSGSTVGPNSMQSWRQGIYPYTKSPALFKCPSNPIGDKMSPMDGYAQSYDVTDTGPIRLNQKITENDIPSPDSTILMFEENGDNAQAQQLGVPWDKDSGEAGWTHILYGGHRGGSNYAFCDGHVKWYRPTTTIVDGVNTWHLNNRDAVSPRALQKLQAAEKNFPVQQY